MHWRECSQMWRTCQRILCMWRRGHHAPAFALAVRLSEAGCFTWSEWATALGQETKAARARGDPDLGRTYYLYWLNALEHICITKGLVGPEDMHRRLAAWRSAYLRTPHGQPVELSAADKPVRSGD
jgi:nitrile hydratase accessory protein